MKAEIQQHKEAIGKGTSTIQKSVTDAVQEAKQINDQIDSLQWQLELKTCQVASLLDDLDSICPHEAAFLNRKSPLLTV